MQIFTTLAGLNFRPASAKAAVDELEIGQEMTLEREPENPYDSNAVRVIDPGSEEFIGFIPKTDNAEIAQALDDGVTVTCTLVGWAATRKPSFKVVIDNGLDD